MRVVNGRYFESRAHIFLKEYQFWIVVFAFLLIFFSLTPLQVDDYTFHASYRNIHSVSDFFSFNHYLYDHVNGRVVGNLISLIMSSCGLASIVARATTTVVLLLAASKLLILGNGTRRNLLVAVLFFLPANIFGQTYGWAAGFYNYVIPVAVTLLMTLLIKVWSGDISKQSSVSLVGFARMTTLLALGIVGSLCVENITLVLVITSFIGLFLCLRRPKLLSRSLIIISAMGVWMGAIIMFGSPIYKKIVTGHSGYQQIGSGITGIVDKLANSTTQLASYLMNPFVIFIVSVAFVLLLVLPYIAIKRSGVRFTVLDMLISATGILSIAFITAFSQLTDVGTTMSKYKLLVASIEIVSMAGIFLSLTYFTFRNIVSNYYRNLGLLLLGLSVLSLLPLMDVSPITPRVVYATYIFLTLYAFCVANYVYGISKLKSGNKNLKTISLKLSYILLLSVLLLLVGIFGAIRWREASNVKLAEEQISAGKSTIMLKKYPFFNYMNKDSYLSAWPSMYFSGSRCSYRHCDQIHITVTFE